MSMKFQTIYILNTSPVSIDLRNCKKVEIENVGKSSLYLGSSGQTLQQSQPEMFTLLPKDNNAYHSKILSFKNPNQLFNGPIFVRVASNPTSPTDEAIQIAKYGCY